MSLVIGLISGTSVDGIDATLVDISGTDLDLKVELIAGVTYPYPEKLREKILAICAGARISMAELAELDDAIAQVFAQAAKHIQIGQPTPSLIGSHGQTVYHKPPVRGKISLGYSMQLGRGVTIANITGIPTVSNFRAADIAVGGHGAPLVPRVDAFLLSHPYKTRCIQNIGGIGNVTYIPPRGENWLTGIRAWDTGPGNSLLDLAVKHLSRGAKTYDKDGAWAASGTPCESLVKQWLQQEYFHLPPPKSTGRELFGQNYWEQCIQDSLYYQLSPADLLATLTELTAASIAHSYQNFLQQMPQQVFLCGGGSRNLYLKSRLQILLRSTSVLTTDEVGLSTDFKEAIAFAVLAYWQQQGVTGNLANTTGAQKDVLLGDYNKPLERYTT